MPGGENVDDTPVCTAEGSSKCSVSSPCAKTEWNSSPKGEHVAVKRAISSRPVAVYSGYRWHPFATGVLSLTTATTR